VYISIIVTLVIILAIPTSASIFASADDLASIYKRDRLAINPDFAPDESCLFDVFQDKCVPGSQQECPEGFGTNEDYNCIPLINDGQWGCPDDGYHSVDNDETGQCYPNSGDSGCKDAYLLSEDRTSRFEYILLTGDDSPNPYDTCANPSYLCDDQPDHSGCKEYREWQQNTNN
jgi:hypothetical protein